MFFRVFRVQNGFTTLISRKPFFEIYLRQSAKSADSLGILAAIQPKRCLMDLEKRMSMAAESILENESLREGLDDEAGNALLDWGIAIAQKIAGETANLEDDEEAEEASYPRMRGLRKLLRAVVSLCAEAMDETLQAELVQEIANQVPLVYGPQAPYPDTSSWTHFLNTPTESKAQKIIGFRALLEENQNTD